MDVIEKFLNKISYKFEKGYPDLSNPKDINILEGELRDAGVTPFSNWRTPSPSQLKQEFKIEQEMKDNEFWENEEEFLKAVSQGQISTITPQQDQNIDYRSHTQTYDELHNLIKSYNSYPEFRNEGTLKALYNGFKENKPMDMPIVVEFSDGGRRIFSGNTRMDVAIQLGINPRVIIAKSKKTQLNEGKQVGNLYHWTDINSMGDMFEDNKKIELDNVYSSIASQQKYFSFTRNPKLNTLGEEKSHVRIALDGNKLATKYRIKPYADPNYKKAEGKGEAEERIDSSQYGGKINLEPYITKITLISPENFNQYLSNLDYKEDKKQILRDKYDIILKELQSRNINFDYF